MHFNAKCIILGKKNIKIVCVEPNLIISCHTKAFN